MTEHEHTSEAQEALGVDVAATAAQAATRHQAAQLRREAVFELDDVTVSRRHAELNRDGDTFSIRDLGSLNGTYVNRRRIESAVLENDDEVQIGKYRLTFLQR